MQGEGRHLIPNIDVLQECKTSYQKSSSLICRYRENPFISTITFILCFPKLRFWVSPFFMNEGDLENTSLEKGAMLSVGNYQALRGIQFLENLIIRRSFVPAS